MKWTPTRTRRLCLRELNRQATINALVWDRTTATISVCCAATVHQDIASWIYYVLATAAILNDLSTRTP